MTAHPSSLVEREGDRIDQLVYLGLSNIAKRIAAWSQRLNHST